MTDPSEPNWRIVQQIEQELLDAALEVVAAVAAECCGNDITSRTEWEQAKRALQTAVSGARRGYEAGYASGYDEGHEEGYDRGHYDGCADRETIQRRRLGSAPAGPEMGAR